MNIGNTTVALAVLMGAFSLQAKALEITFDASEKRYINLNSGDVSSRSDGAELMIHRDTIKTLVPVGYTGESGDDGYANVTNANKVVLKPTLKPSRSSKILNENLSGDELKRWNLNWWGNQVWTLSGENIKSTDFPLGANYYENNVLIVKDPNTGLKTGGLLYPRKDDPANPGVDYQDVVALPFNQLIVRTSKGNRYVRLKATHIGDSYDPKKTTLVNWATNNVYFKYAVAGPDGVFGEERNMCVSFLTGGVKPYANGKLTKPTPKITQNPSSNRVSTFGYSFSSGDKWYKQQFIDFDTIINGPGSNVPSIDKAGKVDISNYVSLLNKGYSEGCMEAFFNTRPASAYPKLYVKDEKTGFGGFYYVGADTPLSSRRADWIDNDNNPVTPFAGNDEWDIAINFMAVPKNIWDSISQKYRNVAQLRINSGRTGDNKEGTVRNKSGYAAAVLVPGRNIKVNVKTPIGDATGDYTEIKNIDTPLSELGGKTVRESLSGNGKTLTEKYTSIDIDNSGRVISNKRVYILNSGIPEFGDSSSIKFRVKSYDAETQRYTLEYDYL